MGFEPTYLAYSDAGKPFGKTGYPEWLKNNYEGEIEAANKRIAFLESQRNASIEIEKANARKALYALAGAHFCTPIEGYGSNASWAISDLCRAVKELAGTKRELEGQLDKSERMIGLYKKAKAENDERLMTERDQARNRINAALVLCNTVNDPKTSMTAFDAIQEIGDILAGPGDIKTEVSQLESDLQKPEKDAELKGWQNAIDSIRASLQCYPNAGGDIVIMQEVERIVGSQLAEAQAKCAELTQRLSQAQSRAGAALGMISDYGLGPMLHAPKQSTEGK